MLNLVYRPIKIGHSVNPTDSQALQNAIEINSFLWGGAYNPLIPSLTRVSKHWIQPHRRVVSGKDITKAVLQNFDPDFLVGNKADEYHAETFRGTITSELFWKRLEEYRTPLLGIGIYDLTESIIKNELKFQRNVPLTFKFPNIGKRHRLFLSSVFGALPKSILDEYLKYFGQVVPFEIVDCDINNFHTFLDHSNLFLRRITNYAIDANASRRGRQMVFVLDAENELDVMDYWTFRALGKNVIPLPLQSIANAALIENTCMRIKEIWAGLGGDPNSSDRITVQKSRTIQLDAFKKCSDILIGSLKSLGVIGSLSIRQWFPRIWEPQFQFYDEVECAEIEHKKKTVNQEHASDEISIPTPPLSVMEHHGFGDALYAIEVEFRIYGSESLYAEVIPETTNGLASDLGSIERKAWRFSNRGIIHLCRHVNLDARLKIPLGESVFKKWMSDRGWKVETSSPGKIGYHLLKHLKGLWGTAIFMNENIMRMFSEMSGSRYKTYPEVRAFAERAVNESIIRWNSADRLIQQLLEVNAIQIGIELQCGMCSQRSWFPVTSFQASVPCPKCLLEFKPPLENPRSINWAYRTIGPFNSPDHASGMFSVLLTLRFFSTNLNLSTTSHLSFIAQKSQLTIEADLGILYKREPYEERRTEPVPIFCECKSFNEFLQTDFVRMKKIAQEFPGSIIVFSTLRNSITRKEKSEIAKIARYGRKLSENLKPRNLVMVLTGDQMLAHHWPPEKWKDAGEPFSSASTAYGEGRVDHICEVTQKLYLGLEGLRQYVEAEVEKRRKKTKEIVSN